MAFVVAAFETTADRNIADTALSRAGHTAVLFTDGAAALAETLAGLPDVVVLQDRLGRMTAKQVYETMRADPFATNIPVVVCGLPRRGRSGVPGRTVDLRQLAERLPDAVATALNGPVHRPAARMRRSMQPSGLVQPLPWACT